MYHIPVPGHQAGLVEVGGSQQTWRKPLVEKLAGRLIMSLPQVC